KGFKHCPSRVRIILGAHVGSGCLRWKRVPFLTCFTFTKRVFGATPTGGDVALYAHLHYSNSVSWNSVVRMAISNLPGNRHVPCRSVLRCEGRLSHQAEYVEFQIAS